MKAWIGDVLGEVCENCVTARDRPYYSWKSVACKDALFMASFPLLFPIQWCFGKQELRTEPGSSVPTSDDSLSEEVLLQLSCRRLCPVWPQSRDDSTERVPSCELAKKRAVHVCSSKAEIVLYHETRKDKEICLNFFFSQLTLILEHVSYFCYSLHVKHTKLPDLI